MAEADLDEIWLFSAEPWGEEQADRYAAQLLTALYELADGGRRSRPAEFVKAGLRKARCQRHFVYFRQSDTELAIARILHDSMDATLHIV